MTQAMTYEGFVRKAFEMNGVSVSRWGDPAGMANTDTLDYGYFDSVKATVAYSITAFNVAITNQAGATGITIDEQERTILNESVTKALHAKDTSELHSIIVEYRDTYVLNKYKELIDSYKA